MFIACPLSCAVMLLSYVVDNGIIIIIIIISTYRWDEETDAQTG